MGELRAAAVTAVHVVVPDGIDDPARPSGGNVYDRHLCRGLRSIGWYVDEHPVPGGWPRPDAAAHAALQSVMQGLPDNAVVLIDGLVASTSPELLVAQAGRLRLVVLVHMPLGHRPDDDGADGVRVRERAVLRAAVAVITTSAWSRRRLLELYRLPADRVHVAEPAVDAVGPAAAAGAGGPGGPGEALLCVAAVTRVKGHDVLLEALAAITDLSWHCVCVGSLDRDPAFVAELRRRRTGAGLHDRVCFTGPRTGADLDRSYAGADLLLLPSRIETYGMVVIEALARGLPVVAADVGGVTEALGHGTGGIRPGWLIAPEDPAALGAALRAWLCDATLRARLRQAASERRQSLPRWSTTTSRIAAVLAGASR
ncbi:MAG: glycosyltransferase family 4 protein [Solirubrobacteraceae bacterium]